MDRVFGCPVGENTICSRVSAARLEQLGYIRVGKPKRRRGRRQNPGKNSPGAPSLRAAGHARETQGPDPTELNQRRPSYGVSAWSKSVVGVGLPASVVTLYEFRPLLTPSIDIAGNNPFPARLRVLNSGYSPINQIEASWLFHKSVFASGNTFLWSQRLQAYQALAQRLPPGDVASLSLGQSVRMFTGSNKIVVLVGDVATPQGVCIVRTHPDGKTVVFAGSEARSQLVGTTEDAMTFSDVSVSFRYSPWLIPLTVEKASRFFLAKINGTYQWTIETAAEPDRVTPRGGDVIEISDAPFTNNSNPGEAEGTFRTPP